MNTDVLSDVLSAVRLTGSVFHDVSARPPWVAEAPPAAEIAAQVMPGAQHVIEYHVVTQGSCWINIVDGAHEPTELHSGDIAVFPLGDPHALSSVPGMRAEPIMEFFRRPEDDSALPFMLRTGEEGEVTHHLVCGFFSCDARPFNPLLDSLPRFMRVSQPANAESSLLGQFIRFAMAEANDKRAGSQSILTKLSELMFVEVIRLYLDSLPEDNTGWLAGLRDPHVGRALALLHARPAHSWALEELAREAGLSRSGLADRFSHFIGCPPMQYLTRWRMQMAASKLADRSLKMAAIAQDVGYESEAAFSRAFKKFVGVPPSEWRETNVAQHTS